jgi:hypothetical protein
VRHNEISNTLSTAPDRFEPIYRRKPNRDIDAPPWCRGFYAAVQLRMSAWEPLLNTDDINHSLLLPNFVHCIDDQERPPLGSTRKGPEGKAFLRKAYTDIPAVVEAMRQYWMPIRYRRDASLSPTWKLTPVTNFQHAANGKVKSCETIGNPQRSRTETKTFCQTICYQKTGDRCHCDCAIARFAILNFELTSL